MEVSLGNYTLRLFWHTFFLLLPSIFLRFSSVFPPFFLRLWLFTILLPRISHSNFHRFPTVEFTLGIHVKFDWTALINCHRVYKGRMRSHQIYVRTRIKSKEKDSRFMTVLFEAEKNPINQFMRKPYLITFF